MSVFLGSRPTTAGSVGAVPSSYLDTDTALTANSDTRLATQRAMVAYIAAHVAGLWNLKGTTDCSANPNYPSAVKGDAYVVSVAGKIGGASGTTVDVGDVYVALADNAGGTQAAVGTSWSVLQANLVGALLAANNLSDVANAGTARTNLGLAIGTNVEAWNANLDTLAGTTPGARGLSLLAAADAATATALLNNATASLAGLMSPTAFAALGGPQMAQVSTSDATVTTCGAVVPQASKVTAMRAVVTGRKSDGSAGASYVLEATFRTNGGGTVTQITTTTVVSSHEDDGTWDATIDTNSTNLRVRVTGVAATTINWTAFLYLWPQG